MQENYRNDEIEIDLRELFFELLSHWKMIAVSTVLAGAIGLVISLFLITPMYESISELYVLSKSTSITSLADIQMGSNLTNDYLVVVKGRPVVEQVIENLGLDETYKTMLEKIEINNPSDSRILQIVITDPDPARAKQIADEMAKVSSAFISEKMDQDPPTIIQYGYADGEPVSPNVLQNTAIGLLLGMLLAMAVVIVSYLMNDTIMGTDDIERKLGLNLLGTLPYEEDEGEEEKKKPVKIRAKKLQKKHA